MNRDVPQACVLSPEKCIVVAIGIIPLIWEKADDLNAPEGSSPECVMASRQDTTGVLDHGGNLGTREIQMFSLCTTIRLMGAGQPMRRSPGAGKGRSNLNSERK
jgi:hypothetical protein